MGKAVAETKKLIGQIEAELKCMREEYDRVWKNNAHKQIEIGLRIDSHVRYLETLKALLKTLEKEENG
jgi:hypothetical protein